MRLTWTILLSIFLAGCATTVVYNPMQVASRQELLLNESSFRSIQNGMTLEEVHKIMGTELVIGYQYQSPGYKPLTIPNPYKTEKSKDAQYVIEDYIESIRQPDGVVRDDELMPLVFKNGVLIGRGRTLADTLRQAKPSA